jgi:hypothetical protein
MSVTGTNQSCEPTSGLRLAALLSPLVRSACTHR